MQGNKKYDKNLKIKKDLKNWCRILKIESKFIKIH